MIRLSVITGPGRRQLPRALFLLLAAWNAGAAADIGMTGACADARAQKRAVAASRAGLVAAADQWAWRRDEVLADLAQVRLHQTIAAQLPAIGAADLDAAVAERSKPQPERLQLRHIFRRVSVHADSAERAAARSAMEGYLAQLNDGASLADLARRHSDSESATAGGLVGWVARSSLEPSLAEQLWKLQPGESSGIIDTPLGFHIFHVEGREAEKPAQPVDRESVRIVLQRRAQDAAYREFMQARAAALGLKPQRELLQPPLGDATRIVLEAGTAPLSLGRLQARWAAQDFIARRQNDLETLLGREMEQRVLRVEAYCGRLPDDAQARRELSKARADWQQRRNLQRRAAGASETELRAFYTRHAQDPKRWWQPEQRRLRGVVVAFGERSPHGVYEELDQLRRGLGGDADAVARLARQRSDDPSSAEAGDWGWVETKALAVWAGPRLAEAVAKAGAGEIAGPLMVEIYETEQLRYTPRAYALIQVEAIRPAGVRRFEDMEPLVREQFALDQQQRRR